VAASFLSLRFVNTPQHGAEVVRDPAESVIHDAVEADPDDD
jgi:hypothetical protein